MLRTALKSARWLIPFALAAFLFLGLQVLVLYGVMIGYCLWEGGGLLDFFLDPQAAARAALFQSLLWPARVESYNEMMQQSGVGQLNGQAILATVVLAPVVEEIFCRGLMLYFASRALRRFWAANLLQALGFAFLHMNWVQGIYAFLCGLVLGALFGRYRRLSYCMLLHAVVNGSSIFAALAQVLLPSGAGTMAAFTGLGLLLLLEGLKRLDCPRRALPEAEPIRPDRWVWKD